MHLKRKYFIAFISFLFSQFDALGQSGNTFSSGQVINVRKFGAIGNGKSNDYAAIQKAIAELHRLKTGTLFFPKGIYKVDEVFRQNEMGKVLNGKSHFFFIGLKNISIKGEKGTIISIKGNFHKKTEWEIKERNFGYSFDHQISFIFRQCRNITIENIEINGNCDKMTHGSNTIENTAYGFLFGYVITDTVQNVRMKNVYVHHMSTDGVCWKGAGGGFYAEKLKLKNNGRCALSIVQGKNMRFVDCEFSETGVTGKYESHSPNTGVDIENESYNTIENIIFQKCRFVRNKNTQFVATGFDGVGAGRTADIHLDNCYFEENRQIEPVRDRAVMITTDNSSITNSTIIGTLNFDINGCNANGQPDKGVTISNCIIKSKGYGIRLNCEFKVRIEKCKIEQVANLDEESCKLNYPFISGGPNVILEGNTFVYNASNWRQTHQTLPWSLNHYIQGCQSVSNNTFELKEESNKRMPANAKLFIFMDKKFHDMNKVSGTKKIIIN